MIKLLPDEKDKIVSLFWEDPVMAAINLMPHYFAGSCCPASHPNGITEFDDYSKVFIPSVGVACEMPWVHRGCLAVLLRRADWLDLYGETDKIYEEFVAKEIESGQVVKVFKMHEDGSLSFAVNFDKVQLLLPRGSAKTTLVKIAIVLLIAYKVINYFVYVSAAQPHAEMQLKDIKEIISEKPRFVELFGSLRPAQRQGKSWSSDEIETTTGVMLGARGITGQIRGLQSKGRRPKLIILDDIEDEENVSTELQRKKASKNFHSVVEPALAVIKIPNDQYPPTLIAINTLLSMASLNASFLKSNYWLSVRFGAKDSKGLFWFPLKMNEKEYEAKKLYFTEQGELKTFHLEYDNLELKLSDVLVHEDWIKLRPVGADVRLHHCLAVDPAISEEEKADEAAISVIGMQEDIGLFWVRENIGKQGWHVASMIDKIFELVQQYSIEVVGVESNAYQAVLKQLLKMEMPKRNRYFHVVGLTHHKNKTARVKGWLRPLYSNGTIFHERPFTQLELQLQEWYQDTQKKDRADCLAMAVSVASEFSHLLGEATSIDDETGLAQVKIIEVI